MDGILVAAIGVLAASLLGRTIVAALGLRLQTKEGEWGAAFAAGYAVLGSAYAVAGFAGAFSATSLAFLTWAALAVGSITLAYRGRRERTPYSAAFEIARRQPGLGLAAGTVAMIVGVAAFTRSLAPSTEGDALCYHLELPRQFLKLGRITFLPWTDHSLLPLLADIWYALPLSTGSVLGPRLISLAVAIAFTCGVVELSVIAGGLRAALWAATLVLAAPVVGNHASVCFSDLPVALFAAWSSVILVRMSERGEVRWGDAGAFGLYAAGAAACKLTGFIWCVCAGAVALGTICRGRRLLLPVAAAAVAVLAVAVPWYARAWYHAGNPFFPFASRFWPGSEVVYDWRPPKQTPVPRSPLPLVSLPWRATIAPEQFGGRGHQWGIAFLALLPGVFLARRTGLQPVLVVCGLYAAVWACTRQNLRFLLPVMPALAAGGAVLIETARRHAPFVPRAALGVVLLLHLATGLAAAGRKAMRTEVWLALFNTQRYLAEHEPTFELGKRLEALLPPGSVVLTPEHRLFYLPGVVLREDALRRWLGYRIDGRDYLQLCRFLGVTHVLLVRSFNPDVASYDQALAARIASARDELRLLLRHRFRGHNGDDRLYELFEIKAGPAELPRTGDFDVRRARSLATELRSFRERVFVPDRRDHSTTRQ